MLLHNIGEPLREKKLRYYIQNNCCIGFQCILVLSIYIMGNTAQKPTKLEKYGIIACVRYTCSQFGAFRLQITAKRWICEQANRVNCVYMWIDWLRAQSYCNRKNIHIRLNSIRMQFSSSNTYRMIIAENNIFQYILFFLYLFGSFAHFGMLVA